MKKCENCNKYNLPSNPINEMCIYCNRIQDFINKHGNQQIYFLVEYNQEKDLKYYHIWIIKHYPDIDKSCYYIVTDLNGEEFLLQPETSEMLDHFGVNDLLKLSRGHIPILTLLRRDAENKPFRKYK